MQIRTPGKERMIPNARDLDATTFRRLVANRYRRRCNAPEPPLLDEAKRRSLEQEIAALEKINQRPDFLPARYLADGVERARAVCRISGPMGMGTGFLVARGVIMTNNHVLEDTQQAEASVAEFNFETGQTPIVVPLQPQRLFLTDADLDFTIVGCDDALIAEVRPIALLRDPATITRGELAAIIQHPAGRPKEVALHNNEVIRVQDKVVHYRTDTEPGSSGSPVFNNQWQLVALHHAGWAEPNNMATNEGVRISSIVAKLEQAGFNGVVDRELFRELLDGIEGTSPYLGFFDRAGLPGADREIVVDAFAGTRDFADVGFWNIEHFNDDVSAQRIGRVADVFQGLQMDVMGLIEVEEGAIRRLVRELGTRGLAYDYEISDGPGRQDLAVLYDEETSSVKIRSDLVQGHIEKFRERTATGKSAFPRLPLIAECEILERVGTKAVRFLLMTVHLKAFGDPESQARRRLAARILSEVIADIRESEDLPVILGGDFNDLITSNSLGPLRDAPDLFSMTLDDAIGPDPSAITYVGRSHRSLIDHIVVSGDVEPGPIMGDDAAIVRLDRRVRDFSGRVSDHVPVVFRMVYRAQELEIQLARVAEAAVVVPAPAELMVAPPRVAAMAGVGAGAAPRKNGRRNYQPAPRR